MRATAMAGPPRPRRPLCAICDGTNETMRLCDACRADPANGDWSEGEPAELPGDIEVVGAGLRFADLGGRRLRSDSDRKRAIVQLVHGYAIRVAYRPTGRRRAEVEWLWQRRALNLSEIAFLVGCSPQAVTKVLRKILA